MIESATGGAWQHRPALPPDGHMDIEALRPVRVVRVRSEAERQRAVNRAPKFVRVVIVDVAQPPIPIGLPTQKFSSAS